MTKKEFLAELRGRLKGMPQEEIENAIAYYEEYFTEAGEENEAEVLRKIGSPASVAAKIIGEYAVNNADSGFAKGSSKAKTGKKTAPIWLLILAIFASPIALPVSIALLCALCAVCFALFIVFIAFGISGIALFAGGIITLGASVALFFSNFALGLFYIGDALLSFAGGAALVIGVVKLAQLSVLGIQKLLGKILIKKGSK